MHFSLGHISDLHCSGFLLGCRFDVTAEFLPHGGKHFFREGVFLPRAEADVTAPPRAHRTGTASSIAA